MTSYQKHGVSGWRFHSFSIGQEGWSRDKKVFLKHEVQWWLGREQFMGWGLGFTVRIGYLDDLQIMPRKTEQLRNDNHLFISSFGIRGRPSPPTTRPTRSKAI